MLFSVEIIIILFLIFIIFGYIKLSKRKKKKTLLWITNNIMEMLRIRDPITIDDVPKNIYKFSPYIPKSYWNDLGDAVNIKEKQQIYNIDGNKWISLRLDGSGFSKLIKALRRQKIIEKEGFSYRFAKCMQESCIMLMDKFNGVIGFTQSDEIIIFIPPTRVIRGIQEPHNRKGRVCKIATLAAGLVTSKFVTSLLKCIKDDKSLDDNLEDLSKLLPHFDCRVASYDSWEEARGLLLWRGYDCSVNGISDAVHHNKSASNDIKRDNTKVKIKWLYKMYLENDSSEKILIPDHQAYGSLYKKVEREVLGCNPTIADAPMIKTIRRVIEKDKNNKPILILAKEGLLDSFSKFNN